MRAVPWEKGPMEANNRQGKLLTYTSRAGALRQLIPGESHCVLNTHWPSPSRRPRLTLSH